MIPICSSHRERDRWLEERQKYVTASDAPIIMGSSPWSSPLRLYQQKLGLAPGIEQTEAMEWGILLEPVIARQFGARTGFRVQHASEIPADMVASTEHPFLAATIDGWCYDPDRCVLEIKTAGAFAASQWEDEVPEHYILQVQAQMLVTGCERAYIVALLAGQRMVYTDISADTDVQAQIIVAARDFNRRVELHRRLLDGEDVEIDPPSPDSSREDARALSSMTPTVEGEEVVLDIEDAQAHDEITEIDEQIKSLNSRKDELKNQIRAAMGSAEIGHLPGGGYYTNKKTKRGMVLRFSGGN